MSLVGYIAGHDSTIGSFFDWLQNGEVEFATADDRMTFHMSPASAGHWHAWGDGLGASVWLDGHPGCMTKSDLADPERSP
jgi:hypothetical protein